MMITVYSQPDCPHCDRVKRQLTGLGEMFEEIDVARHPAARKMIQEVWGYSQVPVVSYDGDTILNPNPNELEDFIYGDEKSVFDEY